MNRHQIETILRAAAGFAEDYNKGNDNAKYKLMGMKSVMLRLDAPLSVFYDDEHIIAYISVSYKGERYSIAII